MRFALYIAKRYLFNASNTNAINIINGITLAVVIIGAAALFIVLAAFAGLKDLSLKYSNLAIDPDLKIEAKKGKSFALTPTELEKIGALENIAYYSQVVEERIFLNYKQKNMLAYIKAVDSNYTKIAAIDSLVFAGDWYLTPNTVVAGYGIVQNLGTGLFDTSASLEIIVPNKGKGSIVNTQKPYTNIYTKISGIYKISEELDKRFIFTNIHLARALLQLPKNAISALEIKLKDPKQVNTTKKEIAQLLQDKVKIKTKTQLNDALYKMLNTEHIAIYIIFTLILIVALFNLVGAIIMLVLDKKKNLKTLYRLGCTIKDLQRIFLYQGILISFIGGIIGVILGVCITFIQIKYEILMVGNTQPYPMQIRVTDLFIVLATLFCLGMIASKIAASRISLSLLTQK